MKKYKLPIICISALVAVLVAIALINSISTAYLRPYEKKYNIKYPRHIAEEFCDAYGANSAVCGMLTFDDTDEKYLSLPIYTKTEITLIQALQLMTASKSNQSGLKALRPRLKSCIHPSRDITVALKRSHSPIFTAKAKLIRSSPLIMQIFLAKTTTAMFFRILPTAI